LASKEVLATAGRQDGVLLLWEPGEEVPCTHLDIPLGVVGGTFMPGVDLTLLLILDTGKAGVWRVTKGKATLEKELPHPSVRGCSVFDRETLHECGCLMRRDEITRIAGDLVSCHTSHTASTRHDLHDRLVQLGAREVSLQILAEEAGVREHSDAQASLEVLRYRHEQEPLLPNSVDSLPVLRQILDLYQRLWLLEDAYRVHERMRKLSRNCSTSPVIENAWIQTAAEAGNRRLLDIGSEHAAYLHIDALQLLGLPLQGRFVVGRMTPIPVDGYSLGAERLASAFREAWQDSADGTACPSVSIAEASWVSSSRVSAESTLFVKAPYDGE